MYWAKLAEFAIKCFVPYREDKNAWDIICELRHYTYFTRVVSPRPPSPHTRFHNLCTHSGSAKSMA